MTNKKKSRQISEFVYYVFYLYFIMHKSCSGGCMCSEGCMCTGGCMFYAGQFFIPIRKLSKVKQHIPYTSV